VDQAPLLFAFAILELFERRKSDLHWDRKIWRIRSHQLSAHCMPAAQASCARWSAVVQGEAIRAAGGKKPVAFHAGFVFMPESISSSSVHEIWSVHHWQVVLRCICTFKVHFVRVRTRRDAPKTWNLQWRRHHSTGAACHISGHPSGHPHSQSECQHTRTS
jgi:hypothetical protein